MRQGSRKHTYDHYLLGIRIHQYREVLNWKSADLAHKAGISRSALHEAEVRSPNSIAIRPRSLPEVQREKLYEVFANALPRAGIPFDNAEFRMISGLPEKPSSALEEVNFLKP